MDPVWKYGSSSGYVREYRRLNKRNQPAALNSKAKTILIALVEVIKNGSLPISAFCRANRPVHYMIQAINVLRERCLDGVKRRTKNEPRLLCLVGHEV